MSITIRQSNVLTYVLPYRSPWKSRESARAERRGFVLLLTCNEKRIGRGEMVFWEGFGDGEQQARKAIENLEPQIREAGALSYPFLPPWKALLEALPAELAAAVEMAALDLLAQRDGVPLCRIIRPEATLKPLKTRRFWNSKSPITSSALWWKLKAEPTIQATCDALQEMRKSVPTETRIVVDANQGWTAQDWQRNREQLLRWGSVWIEEPFPDWWNNEHLHDMRLPLVMDESMGLPNFAEIASLPAVEALTLKPSFLGGFHRSLGLLTAIGRNDQTIFLSSALGTQLEKAFLAHCGAALDRDVVVGCGPLLEDRPYLEQLRMTDTALHVPKSPGLGIRSPSLYPVEDRPAPPPRAPRHAPRWLDQDNIMNQGEWDNLIRTYVRELEQGGVQRGDTVLFSAGSSRQFALRYTALRALGAIAVPEQASRIQVPPDSERDWADVHWTADTMHHRTAARERGAYTFPVAPGSSPIAAVLQTSGSTGVPKTQPLSQDQLLFSAAGVCAALDAKPGDCWLLCLPTERVGGLAILERAEWGNLAVAASSTTSTGDILTALRTHPVTHISLVPAQLRGVVDSLSTDTDQNRAIKAIYVGGGPTPSTVLELALQRRLPVFRSWGMTEAASSVAVATNEGPAVPLQGIAVRQSPLGLVIEGPHVGGVHCTGDRGETDAEGNLFIQGRTDDVLISGGVNVSANRIAAELIAHPDVSDAVVVGVPDDRWGQRVVAIVRAPETDEMPCSAALKEWAKKRLRAEECPKEIVVVSRDLRDRMGKVRAEQWSSWLRSGEGGK